MTRREPVSRRVGDLAAHAPGPRLVPHVARLLPDRPDRPPTVGAVFRVSGRSTLATAAG